VLDIIPSAISNRIYTFPKYAAFSALYSELERRNAVSRIVVEGQQVSEGIRDLYCARP